MYKGRNHLCVVGNVEKRAEILVEELSKHFKNDTFSIERRPEEHCNKLLYSNGTWDIFITVEKGVELSETQYANIQYYAGGVLSVLGSVDIKIYY